MTLAFGMMVEQALPVPKREGKLVLHGPMVGASPGQGQKLVVRGALGLSHEARFVGAELGGDGVVVDCRGLEADALRGALVHDESVLCRVFGGLLKGPAVRKSLPVRFELRHGKAFGILRMDGGVVTAAVVGGGLDREASLWEQLVRIVGQDGWSLSADDITPIGAGWPVSLLPSTYEREGGSVILARPCGPAEPGIDVYVQVDSKMTRASVLTQQAKGPVQVMVPHLSKSNPVTFVVAA